MAATPPRSPATSTLTESGVSASGSPTLFHGQMWLLLVLLSSGLSLLKFSAFFRLSGLYGSFRSQSKQASCVWRLVGSAGTGESKRVASIGSKSNYGNSLRHSSVECSLSQLRQRHPLYLDHLEKGSKGRVPLTIRAKLQECDNCKCQCTSLKYARSCPQNNPHSFKRTAKPSIFISEQLSHVFIRCAATILRLWRRYSSLSN